MMLESVIKGQNKKYYPQTLLENLVMQNLMDLLMKNLMINLLMMNLKVKIVFQ